MSTATYASIGSSGLRYNEQRAVITEPRIPNYEDSMIGKRGYARYRDNEDRWYFREEGQDDYQWVHFRQICFVPMIGDKIITSSGNIPDHYQVQEHNVLTDDEIRARTIEVTNVVYEARNDRGEPIVDPTVGEQRPHRVWIMGEVKSLQKPDDTEQVIFPCHGNSRPLAWRFLGTAVGDLELDNRHRTFHDFVRMHKRLETARRDRSDWQNDVDLLGELLREEAENRGWCDEYDVFVDHYNNKSKVAFIEPRVNDYEVEVTMEFTIQVTTTVHTEARNEIDARDNVANMGLGDFDVDLHGHLMSHNYDVTDEDITNVGDASEC